jgi:MoxR-like ATPase
VADIKALAAPVLRHRIITTFYADSEQVTPDTVIARLLEVVPPPKSGL